MDFKDKKEPSRKNSYLLKNKNMKMPEAFSFLSVIS